MLAITKKTIQDSWKLWLITVALSVLFALMFISFYPSIKKDAEMFAELFKAYPQEFLKVFNIDDVGAIYKSVEAFMSVEYFSIIWPIIMFTLTISLASKLIAKEVESKSIIVLMSQPLSRLEIFLGKFLGALILIGSFVFVSVFSLMPLAWLFGLEANLSAYAFVGALSFAFGMSVFGIGLLISASSHNSGLVTGATIGIGVVSYGLQIISNLQESAQNAKYISLFYYYDYNSALQSDEFNQTGFFVLLALGVLSSFIAGLIFTRKDIEA